MTSAVIRKATWNDLPFLLAFEQGVIEAERHFDSTLRASDITYYDLEQMITAAHIELLVAHLEEEVVGCGYARIEEARPYLTHQRFAYLGFMYVLPEYRGRGINKLIVEALTLWTQEQGVYEMRLEVYNENLPALKAYEKTGFIRHMIEMRKEINGNPGQA